jgi:hypothetical protein
MGWVDALDTLGRFARRPAEAWAAERHGGVHLELPAEHVAAFAAPPRVDVVVTLADGREVLCGSLGEFCTRVLDGLGMAIVPARSAAELDAAMAPVIAELLRAGVWAWQPDARPRYVIGAGYGFDCYRGEGHKYVYQRADGLSQALRSVCVAWARARRSRGGGGMTLELARPSFWSEPRDPSAWQRALRRLSEVPAILDPWPCWEAGLRDLLPRRAVPGLYGRKNAGSPLLGVSLLVATSAGWTLSEEARPLLSLQGESFHLQLAQWLVRRSPWLRLALSRLAAGRWTLRSGALEHQRSLRVGVDLVVDSVGPSREEGTGLVGEPCVARITAHELTPLHAPLYLLRSLGWLDDQLRPRLPVDLWAGLVPPTPATVLRSVTANHADVSGFVAIDEVARALWTELRGKPVPVRSRSGATPCSAYSGPDCSMFTSSRLGEQGGQGTARPGPGRRLPPRPRRAGGQPAATRRPRRRASLIRRQDPCDRHR